VENGSGLLLTARFGKRGKGGARKRTVSSLEPAKEGGRGKRRFRNGGKENTERSSGKFVRRLASEEGGEEVIARSLILGGGKKKKGSLGGGKKKGKSTVGSFVFPGIQLEGKRREVLLIIATLMKRGKKKGVDCKRGK